MNRIITSVTTLAVLGGVALSPLGARAEEGVRANVSTETQARPGFLGIFNIGGRGEVKVRPESMATTTREEKRTEQAEKREQKIEVRSDAAVDARIGMLEKLEVRITEMKRLTEEQKSELTAKVTAQITALTELKGRIADGTASTTRAELKNLREFRAFSVVAPQAAITAAADRTLLIVAQLEAVGTKIDARIETAAAAGKDVSAMERALTAYNSHVADAKVLAQDAINLVKNLKTDSTEGNVVSANVEVLKEAREKIRLATQELREARSALKTILDGVKGTEASVEASVEVR